MKEIDIPPFLPWQEPYETEPASVPTRAEIQQLFANCERLTREMADDFISIAGHKRRIRLARRLEQGAEED